MLAKTIIFFNGKMVYRRGYKTLGRGVIMAISDFKEMVENTRKLKGYSQRELAKMIGMSQSTYNDSLYTIDKAINDVQSAFD